MKSASAHPEEISGFGLVSARLHESVAEKAFLVLLDRKGIGGEAF